MNTGKVQGHPDVQGERDYKCFVAFANGLNHWDVTHILVSVHATGTSQKKTSRFEALSTREKRKAKALIQRLWSLCLKGETPPRSLGVDLHFAATLDLASCNSRANFTARSSSQKSRAPGGWSKRR